MDLHIIAVCFAGLTLLITLLTGLELCTGNRKLKTLRDLPPLTESGAAVPRVSIIIPARNEAEGIQAGVTSMLRQDYPDFEVILVNDRSDDDTGPLMEEMSATDRRVKVLHVTDLPPGWLGKNHAMFLGAQAAEGSIYLFSDADIILAPTALSRAVQRLTAENLQHLTALPEVTARALDLKLFLGAFTVFFSLFAKPWKVRDPKSKAHLGVGAFSLIRAETYRNIGTHQAIAMRPDDDMKLAKRVKIQGYRTEVLFGTDMVRVDWYPSLSAMVHGLMKNAFSGIDYRVSTALSGCLIQTAFFVWPFFALFITDGLAFQLYLLNYVLLTLICRDHARFNKVAPWFGLTFALSSLLIVYIVLRAMALTLWQGGIVWRGTLYPLEELKANRV